jgi:hypothetical protein
MKRSPVISKGLGLFTLLIFITLSVFPGCKKKAKLEEPELPPATMDGRNTFGCRFGKEVWVPGSLINPFSVNYSGAENLHVSCKRRNRINEFEVEVIFFRVKDVTAPGQYQMTLQNAEAGSFIGAKTYGLMDTGQLTVTFIDETRRIISGTFSFRLKEKTSGEVIEVSDGRFDAVYIR